MVQCGLGLRTVREMPPGAPVTKTQVTHMSVLFCSQTCDAMHCTSRGSTDLHQKTLHGAHIPAHNAAECALPRAIAEIVLQRAIVTCTGFFLAAVVPSPNCPS